MAGNGGIVGPANTPTTSEASGVWSLAEAQEAQGGGIWPILGEDPEWANVTLLLHFDGDVTDASGNYSPTANTSTSETTIVKYGSGSRRFNNTKLDYASTLLDFGSADWTVEGWVYWDGTAGYGGIVINSSSTSWNDGINFHNNGSTIGLFTPRITTTISSGQWYHFAIVRESGVWAWWLNGSRVGTATAGFTDTSATSSFGFHSAVSNYPFRGYLDDIRVTDGVARYNTASSSISVPTEAYPDN